MGLTDNESDAGRAEYLSEIDADAVGEIVAEKVVNALREHRLPVSYMNKLNPGAYMRYQLPCIPGVWNTFEITVTPDKEMLKLIFLNGANEIVNQFRIWAGNV